MRRVGITPEGVHAKLRDMRIFARRVLDYGWIAIMPPSEWVQLYNATLWRAVGRFRYSISGSRDVLAGAILHLQPVVLARQLRLLAQRNAMVAEDGLQAEEGQLGRMVPQQMGELQWFFRDGQWGHPQYALMFSEAEVRDDKSWLRISHMLRESWRRARLLEMTPSHRHELAGCLFQKADVARIPLVRQWSKQSGGAFALACGAVMSPKVLALAFGCETSCPKCDLVNPHWSHVWECAMGQAASEDQLLARFGWPRSLEDFPLCNRFLEVVPEWRQ